jgi:hypothetical protein
MRIAVRVWVVVELAGADQLVVDVVAKEESVLQLDYGAVWKWNHDLRGGPHRVVGTGSSSFLLGGWLVVVAWRAE